MREFKRIYQAGKAPLLSLFIMANLISPASAQDAGSPGRAVVDTLERGFSVLKDPLLQAPETMPQRRERLWKILEPIFGFDEISKRVLGRHWTERTPQEKEEFKKVFTEMLKNSYLGKTDSYSGERIEYLREVVKDDKGKVQTHFFTVDGKQYLVDFSLFRDNGQWKIYDATVEGVSVVSTYRTQFYEILDNGSFAELMKKLNEKINPGSTQNI